MPSRNIINNESQILKLYQRVLINKSDAKNKKKKYSLSIRRRRKMRGFFRISPKLKLGLNSRPRNKFGKSIKKNLKKSRRLADKE